MIVRHPLLSQTSVSRTFDSVLCFGDSDWWYHNRGHADMQFMRRFARLCRVLYVNSLGVRRPDVSEGRMFVRRVARKCRSIARFYRDGGEGFGVLSPLFAPILEGLAGQAMTAILGLQIRAALRALSMRRPLVWVVCPTAAKVLDRLPSIAIVHQLSDCYSALQGGPGATAADLEQQIAARADVLICSSQRLVERARERYGRGDYLDHGVDFQAFHAAAETPRTPRELCGLSHPIIGFFGNIDGNTVDRALLEGVIRLRPQYHFALVGPMAADFEVLKSHSNVVAIPRRPYQDIPHYGAAFDVCIMPWLQNEWIEHCNPVKLKEYLALGKPIVSTPFPELRHSGPLCIEAVGAQAFAEAIDRALAEDSSDKHRERRAWAAANTWDAKFERVLELLRAAGVAMHG